MTHRPQNELQWRKQLARNARIFRQVRGRWPDAEIMRAAKDGIAQAVSQNLRPVTYH